MFTIREGQEAIITVHYDIRNPRKRDELRRELKREGFTMETESVYAGLYTQKAMEAVRRFEVEKAHTRVYILAYGLTAEALKREVQRIEESWIADFDAVEEKLEDIELMLSNDLLYIKDKEQRKEWRKLLDKGKKADADALMKKYGEPYSFTQIMQMVHGIGYTISDLELGLAKRREREQKEWMQVTEKYLNRYALRIRMAKKYNEALYDAAKKRQKSEGKPIEVKKPEGVGEQ